jgi:hypothetical protein
VPLRKRGKSTREGARRARLSSSDPIPPAAYTVHYPDRYLTMSVFQSIIESRFAVNNRLLKINKIIR